ncbi:PASTA domain-containing protein [Streptomyces sp. NBC_00876]|uniref:PASTA domain-containing protein n=1 Tax=Streptomyces sp. NBC_00876 TaxID=2975853 RepID=UPI00386DFC26|nr:PASTA domain-containing protein [Streptomyces sp. NBC_00876]
MPRPPAPRPATPGHRWWLTTPARVGFVIAVPLLGLVNEFLGFLALVCAVTLIWKGNPWQKTAKVVATIGAMALLGAVLPSPPKDTVPHADGKASATQSPADLLVPPTPSATAGNGSPAARPRPRAADYSGLALDKARDKAEAAGFGVGDHNASDDGRSIWMRSNWTVCFQETGWTRSGTRTIDFGAVQTGAPCPDADGGAVPWPTMPDLVRKTWKTAHKEVVDLGTVAGDHVRADEAYGNDRLPDEGEYDEWRVCETEPAEGGDVTLGMWVTLELTDPANGCPEPGREDGDAARLPDRDKDGDPDYSDPFPGDRNRDSAFPNGLPDSSHESGGSSGSSGGGGFNCPRTRWC